jgi:predicted  nucleic acid-binding Zn-ribbon protein
LKDTIICLIQLQDYDSRIQEIIAKQKEGPRKLQKLNDELDAMRKGFQEQKDRLESLKRDRASIEQDIQDMENRVTKSDIKLSHIKSNKEYQAALKEIDDLNRIKYEMEDNVLQIMEEIEELEKIYDKHKDEQAELEKKTKLDQDQISRELDALEKECKELEKERSEFSQTLDQDLFKQYLFIKERKGGRAIGPVVGGVCQSCHMEIPQQTYNELIRGHSLLSCTNCDRLIYWGEDTYFQKQ